MARYCLTILLGAFLLFQVQPLIAKDILPWFGGGPAVWTVCILFFQIVLVGGYCYAHLLNKRLPPRQQALVHAALLLASLIFLPIHPDQAWKPAGGEDPTFRILLLLLSTVGLPYGLLSATGPLLQAWFSREQSGRSPYRLYALSNVGSLCALLSFPFLVEPFLTSRSQSWTWSALYLAFAVACAWTGFRASGKARVLAAEPGEKASPPGRLQLGRWLILAALPSVMLLAVTNKICQDIAVVPFLWILPLSLYLLTFILTFDSQRWYRREFLAPVLGIGALLLLVLAESIKGWTSLGGLISVYSALLFVCGMTCHGELASDKPAPRHLTIFYLTIAVGGALGGVFVALLAPILFDGYTELSIGLFACAAIAVFAAWQHPLQHPLQGGRSPLWLRKLFPVAMIAGVAAFLTLSLRGSEEDGEQLLAESRNFFGRLQVKAELQLVGGGSMGPESQKITSLWHGRIIHGRQYRGAGVAPGDGTTYYSPKSGVGVALRLHPGRESGALRVGLIGLGAGTLASYARKGDQFCFYEINPDVLAFAEAHFSYLTDARARGAAVETILGDARIQLERQLAAGKRQAFDLLVLDAFSGDAIPIHLLTKECGKIYLQHLKLDGIVVVHLTNHYLDLAPVLRALAEAAGLEIRFFRNVADDARGIHFAQWAVMTSNQAFLAREELQPAEGSSAGPAHPKAASGLLWTDDFSSLWHVLRL